MSLKKAGPAMNKTRYAGILFFVAFLQTTVFSRIHLFGASLNIHLAFVMALAVLYGPLWGGYTGLGLGLLQDIIFAPVLGVRALVFFLMGSLVGEVFSHQKPKPLVSVLMISMASIIGWLIGVIIDLLLHVPVNALYYWKGPLFIECAYNVIFYFIWLALLKKVLPPKPVRTFSSLL